jgi:GxxExxY protein
MPVTSPIALRPCTQKEFTAIDYRVMQDAFECQNELGRLCDELIYQTDLAARLEGADLGPVRTRVPVLVTHCDFSKTYYLDLVVRDSAIYELKVAAQLVADHEAQLLNYLFLGGVSHGKLLNFRPPQVQSRFVNTTLTVEARHKMAIDTSRWKEDGEASRSLRLKFLELVDDWGGFLELPLYAEALTHFLGGEVQVLKSIPLTRNGVALGNQRFHLLAPDAGFRITALAETDADNHEHHLRALLRHSPLSTIQWLNIFQHHIQLVTLTK